MTLPASALHVGAIVLYYFQKLLMFACSMDDLGMLHLSWTRSCMRDSLAVSRVAQQVSACISRQVVAGSIPSFFSRFVSVGSIRIDNNRATS